MCQGACRRTLGALCVRDYRGRTYAHTSHTRYYHAPTIGRAHLHTQVLTRPHTHAIVTRKHTRGRKGAHTYPHTRLSRALCAPKRACTIIAPTHTHAITPRAPTHLRTHTHAMVNRAHTLTRAPDRLPGGVDGSVCVCVTGRPRGAFFGRARDCLIACAGAFTRCERFTNPKSETANSLSIRHINGEVGVPYGSETVFIVRAKF